jgi:hypothetical protein
MAVMVAGKAAMGGSWRELKKRAVRSIMFAAGWQAARHAQLRNQ